MEVYQSLRGLDWSHIRLSYVTHFYINKPNSVDVLSIFDEYSKLPREILDRVLFVVVDDGSPQPYELRDWPLNMIVLRVKEDIPWNNPGARNLGVVNAKSDKVFMTDIDHQLDEESFRTLLGWGNPGPTLWRLPRVDGEGQNLRSHANTFLFSRGHFLKNYGYDESLCGHYGDDVFFVKYMKLHGTRQGMIYWGARARIRNLARDDYHTLNRDVTHNKALWTEKFARIKAYGREEGHSRQFLNFDWEVARVTRRDVPPPGKKDPFWALSWWGRWIFGE